MRREWESILGEQVLFKESAKGGWQWQCKDLGVSADPVVRYATQGRARLAAAAMIYAFFVMEEVTSGPVPPLGAAYMVVPVGPGVLQEPPGQGSPGG